VEYNQNIRTLQYVKWRRTLGKIYASFVSYGECIGKKRAIISNKLHGCCEYESLKIIPKLGIFT
jgi:hypothetical protein